MQVLVAPNALAIISNCAWITKSEVGEVTAHYTDNTTDTIFWPEADISGEVDYFSLVNEIQKRVKSTAQ